MAVALFAHGSKIKKGNGATTEVFTEIPLLGDISMDLPEVELINYPDQSDSSRYPKAIAGKMSNGTVSAPISFNPNETTHAALETDQLAGTIGNYQVAPVAGQKYQFPGIPVIKHVMSEDKQWSGVLTIKLTGAVTRVS